MPWDSNSGTWVSSPLDDTGMMGGPGRPASTPPGYNNPNFDMQRQAQLAGQGSFQPMPTQQPQPQPDYTSGSNWQNTFGSPMNSNPGGASTMPIGSPDIYGSGSFGSTGSGNSFNSFQQPTGGTYKDEFGNQQPLTPLSYMGGTSGPYGVSSTFNGQNVDWNYPAGGGTGMGGNVAGAQPYGNTSGGGMGQASALGAGGTGAVNPDAAYPKFDPAYLSQVQAALEAQNGPYAGRQPGDYAPPDAPANVRNPQTMQDWQDRFYWFAQNPQALANPSAPGAGLQGQGQTVPWQQFTKDVYSDANANRSFAELSGVVDDARLQQAQQQFGWQLGPNGLPSNDAAVAQASAMKSQHPEYSYQVYQRPDGTFGIAARELDPGAQQTRGFYAPGQSPADKAAQARAAAPHPVASTYSRSSGGSGGGYSRPAAAPAKPVYTPDQIKQQNFIGSYGGGALAWAAQHMPPVPAPVPVPMPNASKQRRVAY